jgi:cysteine desulfurase
MFAPTYLDHNATTPLDPAVREAMLPYLDARFGNASSRHEYGRQARAAIDTARRQVAEAVGAHPTEVIFTSGGSEANNLFLKGAAANLRPGVLAVSRIEHPCVREPARQLARLGWELRPIEVDAHGVVDRAAYTGLLEARPRLVSVMLANNETGVIQPVAELAVAARAAGAWFHTDAVQAVGKIGVDFRALGVHAMTLSAHKIHGPLGAGALIVDKRVELSPLIAGGGQERGLRSGTENVPAIVGFGAACALAVQRREAEAQRQRTMRDAMEVALAQLGATLFGQQVDRLAGTSFFAFEGIDGETLVGKLDRAGFACASGSACSSADPEPSKTLLAMGVAPELARNAVRVSLGRGTGQEDMTRFLQTLTAEVAALRGLQAMAV